MKNLILIAGAALAIAACKMPEPAPPREQSAENAFMEATTVADEYELAGGTLPGPLDTKLHPKREVTKK